MTTRTHVDMEEVRKRLDYIERRLNAIIQLLHMNQRFLDVKEFNEVIDLWPTEIAEILDDDSHYYTVNLIVNGSAPS